MSVSDLPFYPKPRCLRYRIAAALFLIQKYRKIIVNRLTSEGSTESRVWVPLTSGSVRFSICTSKTSTRTYAGNIFCRLCSIHMRRRFGSYRNTAQPWNSHWEKIKRVSSASTYLSPYLCIHHQNPHVQIRARQSQRFPLYARSIVVRNNVCQIAKLYRFSLVV